MKITYEFTLESAKTGKPLKRKKKIKAKSEEEARAIAKKEGLIVLDVEAINFWHDDVYVEGVSFKNRDNTSRYKVIRDCKVGHSLILEHESGNRHDKNAIRVLDSKKRQMGYLPRHVAARVMEWYQTGQSPIYSARVNNIEKWEGGGRPNFDLVVCLPTASKIKILNSLQEKGVKGHTSLAPQNLLQSIPAFKHSPSKKGNKVVARDGGGCLLLLAVLGPLLCGIGILIYVGFGP